MTNIQVKFGQRIRKIRTEKGFSQEVLASKSGLHRTYISDIERGDRNVSLKNVEKIAKALGVSAHDLLKD
ncbi:helix-turn-helix domain-containing protein [Candidatus Peregrinibacteria bacterium]|nr:helix-turn-helix domain-containing protein [Candidatus Peregrinibacteria bacterium]